jgi:hypothetical protein
MKNYAVEFDSELFGYLRVEMTEDDAASQDTWIDLNDLLAVNVFVHPDDEDIVFEGNVLGARWLVSIWACKRERIDSVKQGFTTTFNEEIEHIFATDISEA